MKRLVILLLLTWCSNISGQICEYWIDYSGLPGMNHHQTFSVNPGQLIRIDYCTINVPDKLVVESSIGNLSFDIGSNNSPTWGNGFYHGYCEFKYQNGVLDTITLNSAAMPSDIQCQNSILAYIGGIMRIWYVTDSTQCTLSIHVHGNVQSSTIYQLCMSSVDDGLEELKTDTVYIPVCEKKSPYLKFYDCYREYIIPVNYKIIDIPIIKKPSCLGHEDGSIEFPKYPEFNQYNLGPGLYEIKVSNDHCYEDYRVEFKNEELCEWYIPNVFSPNGDGIGDIFNIFTKINHPYILWIYDRWGDLIYHRDNCISNWSGWDGGDNLPGVYAYKIQMLGKIFYGDVTLLK